MPMKKKPANDLHRVRRVNGNESNHQAEVSCVPALFGVISHRPRVQLFVWSWVLKNVALTSRASCVCIFFPFLSCLCGYKLFSVYLNGWLFHHKLWKPCWKPNCSHRLHLVQTTTLPTERASAASQGVKDIRGPGRSKRRSYLGRKNSETLISVIFMTSG